MNANIIEASWLLFILDQLIYDIIYSIMKIIILMREGGLEYIGREINKIKGVRETNKQKKKQQNNNNNKQQQHQEKLKT